MFRKFFPAKNKNLRKKRISSGARSPEGLVQTHPMYQYAMNEYAQTVAPATSNDDGRSVFSGIQEEDEEQLSQQQSVDSTPSQQQPTSSAAATLPPSVSNLPQVSSSRAETDLRSRASSDHGSHVGKLQIQAHTAMSSQAEYVLNEVSTPLPSPPSTLPHFGSAHKPHNNSSRWSAADEPIMPDTTYEEYYGDAYIGGPIRYIYPSGYQSMRPRSGPWKLSIVVCLMMSWLSVFIIGHCSDRVDQSLYDQNEIDDDTLVIETRWCGSRLLYMMWSLTMVITGIATAYCSVIGYIKCRDFAVGNMRSQPPGMVGKSDYYVQIHDNDPSDDGGRYQKTIYQADGTPQFWGHHIYRPTQAAVAIANR